MALFGKKMQKAVDCRCNIKSSSGARHTLCNHGRSATVAVFAVVTACSMRYLLWFVCKALTSGSCVQTTAPGGKPWLVLQLAPHVLL